MDQGQTGNQPLPTGGSTSSGFNFRDFVNFKYMITPSLITVVYVLSVLGITLYALATLSSNALLAVVAWIILNLYVRFILELIIVLFRINDGIQAMAHHR